MLKLLFFLILIILSLSSCIRIIVSLSNCFPYDYSKYALYLKPNGIIYRGEKDGLEIVLKDIQHLDRYKPEGTATLIITCQSKPKTDTLQVKINTQHLDNRYQISSDSIGADVLLKGADLDMQLNFLFSETYFRNINFATYYCSDSIVIDKEWDIVLKRIPTLIQR